MEKAAQRLGIAAEMEFLEGGLHEDPGELRRRLQEAVDRAGATGNYSRIAIGYGVCGRGTVGLYARQIPLALPRAHDCIALFLGSDSAYKREFFHYPGTYYISAGWFEEKVQPRSARPQGDCKNFTPADDAELVKKYGPDNARAIRDFLNSWRRNYQRAVFINTGAGDPSKYAGYARAMAREFGWKYDEIPGNLQLLEKILAAENTTAEVLIVPPGHVTRFDPFENGLKAVPPRETVDIEAVPAVQPPRREGPPRGACGGRLGLGIDAGGTFTDAVIFDFQTNAVLAKAKALTTRWDYTIGIENALAQIDAELLPRIDLVSVSTTLATNAIVEGRGQKVGLLVMPAYGMYEPSELPHDPKARLSAQMGIDGKEIVPVDEAQVRQIAREMIDRHGVEAFAVSGFAGVVNPAHEIEVKRVLKELAGVVVTCGHELSELLNFRTRAQTAVLNARIIPNLEKFLRDVECALQRRAVKAPLMVVKGDGSLMSAAVAVERPVETVFSGPAASVAGARFLTHCQEAFVTDMGGTTTDTASVAEGRVRTCASGARVGRWDTHVQALRMRTVGLGGDSLIAFKDGKLRIGPRRVAPVAWLACVDPKTSKALDYIESRLRDFAFSNHGMELVVRNGSPDGFEPNPDETRILRVLADRPYCLDELARATGAYHWSTMRLDRLEERGLVQRCGLTPTDLLHVQGDFTRWDVGAAERLLVLVSRLFAFDPRDFIAHVIERVVRALALELFKCQLDEETDPDAMDSCPVCRTVMERLFAGDSADYTLSLRLRKAVVGIGAPVHFFLPRAAALVGASAVIPPHADVANAIGAITSSVVISRQAEILPDPAGAFAVHGLARVRSFGSFSEAHEYAVGELNKLVLRLARCAGTGESDVKIDYDDRIAASADGGEIFLGRTLKASLSGRPAFARAPL